MRGFTIIDVLISTAIIIMLFGGIYLIYFSIIDVINNIELRTAATSVVESELEVIRNLNYADVGTVGGVPDGVIPQVKLIVFDNFSFLINTTIRNIDDPFDGTLGGVPNDTAPADYKLVEMSISCPDCAKFVPLLYTATVAPKNLESASQDGSLFINVFDSGGAPISEAQVHVVNSNVTPTIDLIDATNSNGVLQLVGVPTSTQSYEIDVGLSGYSSEQTYSSVDLGGSTPAKPHATVAAQTVTSVSFLIDKVGQVNVGTKDLVCAPFGGVDFSMDGAKLVGTSPNYLKFSTTSVTNASGSRVFFNIEWDTYSFAMNSSSLDVVGTIPFSPMIVDPDSSVTFDYILQVADPSSLLVTVKDIATGDPVSGAAVNLSVGGFSETKIGGRGFMGHTNWSSGQYDSKSGIEEDNPAGSLEIETNASGTYTISQTNWLISKTIDAGGSSSTFYTLNWLPTSQSPLAGSDSVRFQLASNNDGLTWSFIGPDGTASTYYSSSGEAIHGSHTGDRYIRYQVFLQTEDENTTPVIDDVSIEFNGVCVPSSQVLFTNLGLNTYTLDVSASGYVADVSLVVVAGNWQQVEVLLTPN